MSDQKVVSLAARRSAAAMPKDPVVAFMACMCVGAVYDPPRAEEWMRMLRDELAEADRSGRLLRRLDDAMAWARGRLDEMLIERLNGNGTR